MLDVKWSVIRNYLRTKYNQIIAQIQQNPTRYGIFIFVSLIAVWFEVSFFIIFLFAMILLRWDSRISFFFALIFLTSCPFLIILDRQNLAEQAAIYAYFFMAIGVLVQIIENYREKNVDIQNNKK